MAFNSMKLDHLFPRHVILLYGDRGVPTILRPSPTDTKQLTHSLSVGFTLWEKHSIVGRSGLSNT